MNRSLEYSMSFMSDTMVFINSRLTGREALQPKPRRGRCRADQGKERITATIYVATYNVRSLAHSDDLKRLQEQLREIKWNIVGISETKRKGRRRDGETTSCR